MSHLHALFEKKLTISLIYWLPLTFSELPEPQFCLSKNDSGTAYGLCSESFEDGCDHQGVLDILSVF